MFRCDYCKEERKKNKQEPMQSEMWLDMNYHFFKHHHDVWKEMDKHMSRRIDGKWYPMTDKKVKVDLDNDNVV